MAMYRILMNPGADGEGSSGPDEMVTIAAAELEALRAAAAAAQKTAGDPAGAEERLQATERRFDEELTRRTEQAERWERACKAAIKERELATLLAGQPLVRGAASQLIKLWRDELEVIDEAGELRVASKDGRPIAEVVDSWLSSPEYAHFSRPTSRGGTTPPGDSRSATGASGPPRPPKTLGEAALQQWRDAGRAAPFDQPAPIGLGRRRF